MNEKISQLTEVEEIALTAMLAVVTDEGTRKLQAGNLPTTEAVTAELSSLNSSLGSINASIAALIAAVPQTYMASVQQVSTLDPIATVKVNGLPDAVVWTRASAGLSEVHSDSFTDKSFMTFSGGTTEGGIAGGSIKISLVQSGPDFYFTIETRTNAGVASDGMLSHQRFKIEVYP